MFGLISCLRLVNRECDLDTDGLLDQREIQQACKDTGYSDNYDEIRANLKQVTTSATGKIDVEEFIDVSIWWEWLFCFVCWGFHLHCPPTGDTKTYWMKSL